MDSREGLLFTYGSKNKIIESEELKAEFMSKAKEILKYINNYDI